MEHARRMLAADPDLVADARKGAPVGNSVLEALASLEHTP